MPYDILNGYMSLTRKRHKQLTDYELTNKSNRLVVIEFIVLALLLLFILGAMTWAIGHLLIIILIGV